MINESTLLMNSHTLNLIEFQGLVWQLPLYWVDDLVLKMCKNHQKGIYNKANYDIFDFYNAKNKKLL